MQVEIKTIRRAFGAIALSGALALAAGCRSNSVAASGPDPAQANLAPVSQANGQAQVLGQNASYTPQQQGESYPQQQGYPQQAPAPIEQAYPQQSYPQQPGYQPTPDEQAGEEALEETTQAPPELPEYDQPPAPGPGYMWTPGYWAWGGGGYYWVPGAWVEAPYYGALWTPPYWGWNGGYYRFYPGYWGRHVGYYGGINYGFGYIGIGYFGGYWSGNSFYYNSAVTRVGGGIRTVYERPVVYNNVRYGAQPSSRVSYNGGRGGINVQPRPAEIAAMRERHDPPMAVQHQARVEASQNHAQSFAVNRGRPSEAAVQHGFANSRGIAPAPRGVEAAQPVPQGRPAQPYTNERAATAPHGQPYANEPHVENRPVQPQPQPNTRFENRPQPQPQPRVAAPPAENRPAQPQPNAQPRFENRPQPQPQPQPRTEAPRVENQPQPQPRMENRPQPQPQQQHMETPRPESRPPQPHPQAAPPQSHPAPQAQQPHGGGGGHQGDGDHGHR
jgi:hypothetical protein